MSELRGFIDKLTPKQALGFRCLQFKSFENTAGKGEIARNEQYLLFPQCFLPLGELSAIFIKISLKLSSANSFSLEDSKIVFWETDNFLPYDTILDMSEL